MNTPIQQRKPRKLTKWARCLHYLTQRPMFELEAFDLYGDTCLHTTVSDLKQRFGLMFKHEKVKHQHRGGGVAIFTKYTLAPESRERAAALLKPFGIEVKP